MANGIFNTREKTSLLKRWAILIGLGVVGVMGLASPSMSQEAYPNKPINIIVPFAPGGIGDLVARLMVESVSEQLKQPVIVLNTPGGGGAIGSAFVAKGATDGYNILIVNSGNVTYPDAERLAGHKPLYEMSQLEPIALLTNDPMYLVVNAETPYKNLADLVKAAQLKPDAIDYSSAGNLTPNNLGFEMFGDEIHTSFNQIQYKGSGLAVVAVLGGEVPTSLLNPGTLSGQLGSGRLRVLAVSSEKRHPLVPEAPTFHELGYDFEYSIYTGFYVAAGTPENIVRKIRLAVQNAAKSEKLITAMKLGNFQLDYRDGPEFKKYVDESSARVIKVLKKIVKPDSEMGK